MEFVNQQGLTEACNLMSESQQDDISTEGQFADHLFECALLVVLNVSTLSNRRSGWAHEKVGRMEDNEYFDLLPNI
jgi:hypothetical protein